MPEYLDAKRIRALANELDLKPSKGRGQNFLFDGNTVRRIVGFAGVTEADTVLEVGPGLGSLTVGLLHMGAHVVAVEIEESLAHRLPTTMGELVPDKVSNLTVVETDALRMTSLTPEPTALVANLPYNISVPVILHILATFPSITRGLVMVQLEVADRLAAPPGSKVYGVPSAKLAWYASSSRVATVPATVFWPAPNVESGLVSFERRTPPEGADRQATFTLIDAAFSQRRKMLRSVLSKKYGPQIHEALAQAGIPPEARGETLSIHDFARLATLLTQE
ncbi:MAG: 16S rRNA (adenine(1518)-N(6)/adenine(1519)-N(6))-dimethyltransferase RsmA [Propionibacteriaceae bacterium]|jgi:16S rRNA (adenine1518-N6/adenine1519-N6)-dimethyltransferase|nr:16S rRNA (adenine(1518)-N(6)/adenine(1519)-N(6))-dimethyltransferase RsmA [Propionibacteriaceae bacterium]